MSERLTNRCAVEKNLKRLRRFAVSVVGDQNTADGIVLDVITVNKKALMAENCPKAAFPSLLRAVYQNIESSGEKSRSTPLTNPLRTELLDVYKKYVSLNPTDKAIISLLLIEEMSSEKIARITEVPIPEVNRIISESLEFLSGSADII